MAGTRRHRSTISFVLPGDAEDVLPRREPGASPGTLFVNPGAEPTVAKWLRFGPAGCREGQLESADALEALRPDAGNVLWLDVRGLSDRALLQGLAERLGIHPLALADMVNVRQRPKTEAYETFTLHCAHMVSIIGGAVHIEQLSLALMPGIVLTIQERDADGDVLDPVRRRIRHGQGRVRQQGADYLAYQLIDCVIDAYFPAIEEIGHRLDLMEEAALQKPHRHTGERIHAMKRTMLEVRHSIWPMREAVATLLRNEGELWTPPTLVYLRDSHDHAVQVADILETYREFSSNLMDLYLSSVNLRMNEVVKVLTIISTIFLPLSFIAGIYGMNFDTSTPWNMPELHWRYGYVAALALMLAVAVGMLWSFKRYGWLGPRRPQNAGDVDAGH